MKKTGLLLLSAILLAGCLGFHAISRIVDVQGKPVTLVNVTSRSLLGTNITSILVFDERGNLIIHDTGSSPGILQAVLPGAITAAVSAGNVAGPLPDLAK
jgi:hypothetical protein